MGDGVSAASAAAAASECMGGAVRSLSATLVVEFKGFSGGLSEELVHISESTGTRNATGDKTGLEGDNAFWSKMSPDLGKVGNGE